MAKTKMADIMKQPMTPVQQGYVKQLENREWIRVNISKLIEEHSDEWVIIWDKKIQQICADQEEALEAAEKYPAEEKIVLKVPRDEGVIERPV